MSQSHWTENDSGEFPDLIRPINVFRFWNVKPGGLKSIMNHFYWDMDRPTEAICLSLPFFLRGQLHENGAHDDPAPQEDCTCGLYGYHLHQSAVRDSNAFGGTGNVFGVFGAFGSVVIHPLGLRAGRGRIVALAPNHPRDNDKELVAETLHEFGEKGVKIFDKISDLIEEYPGDDLTALMGQSAQEMRDEYKRKTRAHDPTVPHPWLAFPTPPPWLDTDSD